MCNKILTHFLVVHGSEVTTPVLVEQFQRGGNVIDGIRCQRIGINVIVVEEIVDDVDQGGINIDGSFWWQMSFWGQIDGMNQSMNQRSIGSVDQGDIDGSFWWQMSIGSVDQGGIDESFWWQIDGMTQ